MNVFAPASRRLSGGRRLIRSRGAAMALHLELQCGQLLRLHAAAPVAGKVPDSCFGWPLLRLRPSLGSDASARCDRGGQTAMDLKPAPRVCRALVILVSAMT